jgi:hypothetical protein
MAKQAIPNEVQVVHFFEASSVEKAEAVFNIVADRMRERLNGSNQDRERRSSSADSAKRRPVVAKQPASGDGGADTQKSL